MDNLEDRFFLGPGLFSGANLLFVSGSVSFDNPCWWLMKTAQALMRLKQKKSQPMSHVQKTRPDTKSIEILVV